VTGARTSGRLAVTSLLVVLALAGAGSASAFWRGSGTGTGSGTTGTTLPVTLGPGSPTATLYPGGVTNVVLTVTNPNRHAVRIDSLALDTGQGTGGFGVDAGHAGCAVLTLSFISQTNGGAGWSVPGRVGAVDGTHSITLAGALAMGMGAANACQGASYTVYLAAGP
jgi:hypothetical protein